MEFFHWVQVILNNYGALLLKGTGVTILLAIVGTAVGFVIGLLIGIYKTIPIRPEDPLVKRVLYKVVNFLLSAYIELFRSTPMMVQAMVIYYGAGFLFSLRLNPVTAGMFIISINTGAYMAEIIRGGIISVDKGQKEASYAMGLTHWQSMTGIILPQAVRNIMPSIGNEFVVNIKDSSVLNVISVSELFFVGKSAAGTYARYFEAFAIIAAIYFVLTFTTTRLLRLLEKKMDGGKHYTIYGSQSASDATITLEKGDEVPND